jgi:hypothetical protein
MNDHTTGILNPGPPERCDAHQRGGSPGPLSPCSYPFGTALLGALVGDPELPVEPDG